MIQRRHIFILTIVLAAFLAGCADDSETTVEANTPEVQLDEGEEVVEEHVTTAVEDLVDEAQDEESETTGELATTVTPGETNESGAAAPENVVRVELTEFEIRMPRTVPAGPVQFQVTNVGTGEHNFKIEGEDTEVVFESNLQVGETKRVQVDLTPGVYRVYCPVAEHEEKGMSLELTVTGEG